MDTVISGTKEQRTSRVDRQEILRSVAQALCGIASPESGKEDLDEALRQLAHSLDAEQVALFQNRRDSELQLIRSVAVDRGEEEVFWEELFSEQQWRGPIEEPMSVELESDAPTAVTATLLPVPVEERQEGLAFFFRAEPLLSPSELASLLEPFLQALGQQSLITDDSTSLEEDVLHAQALSHVDEAVIAIGKNEKVEYLNARSEEVFDRSVQEAKGLSVGSLFSEMEGSWWNTKDFMEALRKGYAYSSEIILSQDNGAAKRRYEVEVHPLGGEGEGRALAVLRDITKPQEQKQRLEQRASLERVLVDVSQLFVSHQSFDTEELLRRIGRAIEAEHVYLITAPPDDLPESFEQSQLHRSRGYAAVGKAPDGWPMSLSEYTYRDWWRSESGASEVGLPFREDDMVAYAVPILSSNDKLYGYLGIEYVGQAPAWVDDGSRMLDVMGDMLSAYLERRIAEQALRESEERYRSFIATISEAIWCVEPSSSIPIDLPPDEQLRRLREEAFITECNQTMAEALGTDDPSQLKGEPSTQLIPEGFDGSLFEDFVRQGYVLQNKEYSLQQGDTARHYVVNAVGTVEEGRLVCIWGSWTDVTERVELERRMVTALEQQQQQIGHELHDGVGQLITSVSMLSQNLAERYFTEDEPGYQQAQRIVRFTREASQLLREMQRGLAPVQVQGRSLAQSLEDLSRNTDELPGIDSYFDHDGVTDCEEHELKLQLYRIAQEATNNALKHAEASLIEIALKAREDTVVLEISDNGCGFDVPAVKEKSLGLHSMEYRARSINAKLMVDSEEGVGSTVRCIFPKPS